MNLLHNNINWYNWNIFEYVKESENEIMKIILQYKTYQSKMYIESFTIYICYIIICMHMYICISKI